MLRVDSSILIWAFRYCITRRSYAVGDCVSAILKNWSFINDNDKELIVKEIKESRMYNSKEDYLAKEWHKIVQAWQRELIMREE